MYRVRNIVNRRESDVICHSVRRSRVPTSTIYMHNTGRHLVVLGGILSMPGVFLLESLNTFSSIFFIKKKV
jgi:hypothetical protein